MGDTGSRRTPASVLKPCSSCRKQSAGPKMSASHPKADMCGALVHVRFVPIADILIGRLSPKEEPPDVARSVWHKLTNSWPHTTRQPDPRLL